MNNLILNDMQDLNNEVILLRHSIITFNTIMETEQKTDEEKYDLFTQSEHYKERIGVLNKISKLSYDIQSLPEEDMDINRKYAILNTFIKLALWQKYENL